jgi:hypothetical protein
VPGDGWPLCLPGRSSRRWRRVRPGGELVVAGLQLVRDEYRTTPARRSAPGGAAAWTAPPRCRRPTHCAAWRSAKSDVASAQKCVSGSRVPRLRAGEQPPGGSAGRPATFDAIR